jgi:hypothetical protein
VVVASNGLVFFSDASAIPIPRMPDGSFDSLYSSSMNYLEVGKD